MHQELMPKMTFRVRSGLPFDVFLTGFGKENLKMITWSFLNVLNLFGFHFIEELSF